MTDRQGRYAGGPEPANVRSVDDRLRMLASDEGVTPNRLRHRLAVTVALTMIESVVEPGERFVVKGGTAMMLRFGLGASRLSRDLDAALRGRIDSLLDRLVECGRAGFCGWSFTVVRRGVIDVPGFPVKPVRAELKLRYGGHSFATVKLEVSPEELDSVGEWDGTAVSDLGDLGFGVPVTEVRLMSVPFQCAQKLHACTTVDDDGVPGDRAHDLADLLLLEELVRADLPSTRSACERVFRSRARQSWPPEIAPGPDWDARYAAAVDGLPGTVPETLGEAMEAVGVLVHDIATCRRRHF